MSARLAPVAPVRCAGCFNQQPHLRHVDFDSALDRGFAYSDGTATPVSMDELILCENCVKEGLKVLDIEDSKDLKVRLAQAEHRLDVKDKALKQAEKYAGYMEDAIAERKIVMDHRKKPRKEIMADA